MMFELASSGPVFIGQLSLIMIIGSILCGVGAGAMCGSPSASLEMSDLWNAKSLAFLLGFFGGFVCLEIVVGILVATGNIGDLGSPLPYVVILVLLASPAACIWIKAKGAHARTIADDMPEGFLRLDADM
mmetsp:Transcript_84113/g.132813  ORF Transcript_84113/g.132813 Transcript_84113/m.132813 type:complete len:130 (-) Transcript_84113:224-613(-)|eukprot:CAMPEP_0169061800 /NCGR_PEP_ID=MMETSP1015-20121227/328_1 /TAXON_ID=342587 /ORGANISM="Karlodinium micrum, Strain CCMP2283" /LENGTH=129 /DNA_ID=CAMNT_0009119861 /DNA_START=41 /DNA_END=430 /DNA_ORIENTATION=+